MSSPGLLGYVLAGYFVVLIGLSLARVVPVRLPAIQRLRAFFPSWKFFDEVGVVPVLLARVAANEDALADGEWQPCLRPLPRRAAALLVNPAVTLQLACGSLLAQLVAEVEELPIPADVEALASYQMTLALVRSRVALAPGQRFQFKICLCEPGTPPGLDDDMIISPVYTA